jgi:hypothetical protein
MTQTKWERDVVRRGASHHERVAAAVLQRDLAEGGELRCLGLVKWTRRKGGKAMSCFGREGDARERKREKGHLSGFLEPSGEGIGVGSSACVPRKGRGPVAGTSSEPTEAGDAWLVHVRRGTGEERGGEGYGWGLPHGPAREVGPSGCRFGPRKQI